VVFLTPQSFFVSLCLLWFSLIEKASQRPGGERMGE
jgi:hypothetical protein